MTESRLHRARVVLWALHVRATARRAARREEIGALRVPRPPSVPMSARTTRDVEAVLRRTRATCLVESLTLQAWYAAHGHPKDLVLGVTPPSQGFKAHAWLEEPGLSTLNSEYIELHRVPAHQV